MEIAWQGLLQPGPSQQVWLQNMRPAWAHLCALIQGRAKSWLKMVFKLTDDEVGKQLEVQIGQ